MELEFVSALGDLLPPHPHLKLGVGDDAALLHSRTNEVVFATDLLIDGVHFDTAEHSPERIGHKALAVNLSDLAAMAVNPVGAVVGLAIPRDPIGEDDAATYAARLIRGMLPLAERFDCPIAGGDTNVGPGPLVVSVSVVGAPTATNPLTRSGAQAGDWLLVSGELGGSLRGRHLDFTPRVEEALLLNERYKLHAGMDLSDGLALDLRRLAAMNDLGAVIEADTVPVSDAAHRISESSGVEPLRHALCDGEDFELLLAVAPKDGKRMLQEAPIECGLTRIGELTSERTFLMRDASRSTIPLPEGGYVHRG